MKKISNKISQLTPKRFQQQVLTWFDQHGRKSLPWQYDKTPYRVWVSEIMLQQTQVGTVIAYYERFLNRFPTIELLAQASQDEVLHLWTGLGYYSRARNLQRTAQIIVESFAGIFPDDLSTLETLPGIGHSTAGAILAIAFEKKATILDGNVKRVLTRLHGITDWPGEKNVLEKLWSIAKKYTPTNRIADYTQAMMDIGATLCVRSKPRCHECPFQKNCVAHQQGLEKTIPKKKPSKKIPTRQVTLLVLLKNDHFVFLEKRPTSGIWGGLWSLPEIQGTASHQEIQKTCRERFKHTVMQIELGEIFRHTFTHFHLDILPAFVSLNVSSRKVMEATQQIWYNLKQPETIGLPQPIKTLLTRITP